MKKNYVHTFAQRSSLLACLCVFLFLVGCRTTKLTIPSPPTNQKYKTLGQGKGASGGILVFGLIPIAINGRLERAYNQAVDSKGGAALIDPAIKNSWFWTPIGNIHITSITGNVISYTE